MSIQKKRTFLYEQIRKKNNKLIIFFFMTVALFLTLHNISNANLIFILDDEFGYWGNAASLVGYDWSDLMGETVFYSLGYSLLLVPLMLIIKDMFLLYKIAIIVNGILYFFQLVITYYLVKELFDVVGKKRIVIVVLSIISVSPIFYIHFTETETLLGTLYLLSVYLLNRIEKKDSYICEIPFVFALIWMLLTHRRALPVVTLLFFSSCVILIKKKKIKYFLASSFGMALLYFIYKLIIKYQIASVYSNSVASGQNSASATSMAADYVDKFIHNFNDILESVICKLGMASISTYCSVIFVLLVSFYMFLQWRNCKKDVSITIICVLACAFSMILLEAFQLCDSSYRRDFATYTRYFDFVLPPITMYGFSLLLNGNSKYKKLYILSWLITICTVPCMYFATIKSEELFNVLCNPILGAFYQMGFCLKGSLVEDQLVYKLFLKTIIIFGITIYIYTKRSFDSKNMIFFCSIVCMVMIIWYFSSEWEEDRRNAVNIPSAEIYQTIKDDNFEIYYLKSDDEVRNPKYIQYILGDREIKVVSDISDINKDGTKWVLTKNEYKELDNAVMIYESWVLNLFRVDD